MLDAQIYDQYGWLNWQYFKASSLSLWVRYCYIHLYYAWHALCCSLHQLFCSINFSFYFDCTENNISRVCAFHIFLLLFLWVSYVLWFFPSVCECVCAIVYTKINEKFKYFLMHFFWNLTFIWIWILCMSPKVFLIFFLGSFIWIEKSEYILRALNVNCDWLCKVFRSKVYVWIWNSIRLTLVLL